MKHKSNPTFANADVVKVQKMNMQLKSTSNNDNPQHLELQHPSKVQAIRNFLNCSIQVKFKLPAAPCSIQVKLKLENIGHASQF